MNNIKKNKKVSIKKALISGVLAGGAIAIPSITIAAGVSKMDPSQVQEELVNLATSDALDSFGLDLADGASRRGLYVGTILGSNYTWIITTNKISSSKVLQTCMSENGSMEGYRYYTGTWNSWTNKNPDVVAPDVTNAASGGFKINRAANTSNGWYKIGSFTAISPHNTTFSISYISGMWEEFKFVFGYRGESVTSYGNSTCTNYGGGMYTAGNTVPSTCKPEFRLYSTIASTTRLSGAAELWMFIPSYGGGSGNIEVYAETSITGFEPYTNTVDSTYKTTAELNTYVKSLGYLNVLDVIASSVAVGTVSVTKTMATL